MAYAPFDGVLLDDLRPPVPGALAVALHLRVERELARKARREPLPLEALLERSAACRELVAQGLLPDQLRALARHGLELGDPRRSRTLAALVEHLEAYLEAVTEAGYMEPEVALWQAVEAEMQGRRGLWIERAPEDGPLDASWRDLTPVRLRALATLPAMGEVRFRLATRRGDGRSGLFGSPAPSLSAWLLEGLESHGAELAQDLLIEAPEGWAEHAPWGGALESLFEGPLALGEASAVFQRGLVSSPAELLFAAVEQVCRWVAEGLAPEDIALVHPDPSTLGPLLKALFAAEGLPLQVRGAPDSLLRHRIWAPLLTLVEGLIAEDPVRVAAGLQACGRKDLGAPTKALLAGDETGASAFAAAAEDAGEGGAGRALAALRAWRELRLPPSEWADRLGQAATSLGLAGPGDPFFGALGLLKEGWGHQGYWSFVDMHQALEGFLRTATESSGEKSFEGIRLISPMSALEPGFQARATLALDLREGHWPALPAANPDLDWFRRVAVNRALLAQAAAGESPAGFNAALQRFWLPLAEGTEQVPRLLQREAYAFNALLALTTDAFLALTPTQDEEGRPQAQGPFWSGLEGAGAWSSHPAHPYSHLRYRREQAVPTALQRARAERTQPSPESEWPAAAAPEEDRIEGAFEAWMGGRDAASPTALEQLARCPFRSFAERAWKLREQDRASQLRLDRGTLLHRLLQAAFAPLVDAPHWPDALRETLHQQEPSLLHLEQWLQSLWDERAQAWARSLDTPESLRPRLLREAESYLPHLAAYLAAELEATSPTPREVALLWPDQAGKGARPAVPDSLKEGWQRTVLGVEYALGPTVFGGFSIAGTVDRLERWQCGDLAFLRVVDYKTQKKDALRAFAEADAPFRTHVQAPLYAALASLAFDLPATAVLIPLRDEAPTPFDGLLEPLAAESDWKGMLARCIQSLRDRLDRGDLPPVPADHCAHCALAALCGRPVDVVAEDEE
jgi:RecB family exonuclease